MEYDTDTAAEAIRNAVAQENQTDQAPQTTETVPSDVQGTTEEDSLFKNIDPSSLTPELKSLYDSLQGDYTRKTQTLAEQRREYEALGGVDKAKSAVDFVQSLQDPNNLVQLHEELTDYLRGMGYTKEEAAEALKPAPSESFGEDDYEVDPQRGALDKELAEARKFREEYQQERLQSEIEASLARQETFIRQVNPTYTDDDIQSVYRYAYAFGGDLMRAQEAFEGERQRILSGYVNAKGSVPAGVTSPVSGVAGAEIPTKFDSFEEAHAYAKQKAAAIQALGGLD